MASKDKGKIRSHSFTFTRLLSTLGVEMNFAACCSRLRLWRRNKDDEKNRLN